MKRFFLYICLFLPLLTAAQKELKFSRLDSLFTYADKNSSVSKTNEEQTILARYQQIAAIANVVNFRNPVALSLTNNTQLPVNFVPAQLLGGPPGTFKQLTFGQEYVSNFSITPQIDIISPGAWAQISSANINARLTSATNELNTKSLYESIAACYYNILSFREQVSITQQNLGAADTLAIIVTNKFALGLVRQQDVNDALGNKLTLEDKLKQLQISLEGQYSSLKILCDIPAGVTVTVDSPLNYDQAFGADLKAGSQLQFRSALLKSESAKADLRYNRLSYLPVVSLLYSNAYYQNSNNQLFDNNPNVKWLNSAYIGAKVTFFLPDVNRMISSRNASITYQTSLITLQHAKLQNDFNNEQLQQDYEKSYSQLLLSKQLYRLKEENYTMAFNQYNASVLPFDKLLTAFNDMLLSRFNYSNALATLLYTKSKIDINNTLK